MPHGAVNRHLDVPYLGRDRYSRRPKYRRWLQVVRAIANEHNAARQRFGKRPVDNDFGGWLVLAGLDSV
jgi:hypothetical protein